MAHRKRFASALTVLRSDDQDLQARDRWSYPLLATPSISQDHRDLAMIIGDRGRWANRANLVGSAPRFGLTREDAGQVIDRMKGVVRRSWSNLVRKHGGTERDCEAIARAFDYEGFEHT